MTNQQATKWADKLFKMNRTIGASTESKTYFAHRYPNIHAPEKAPLAQLFSGFRDDGLNADRGSHKFYTIATNEASSSTHDAKKIITRDSNLNVAGSLSLTSQCVVLNCYNETQDTKTFRLALANGQSFTYLPGQYVTLAVVIKGQTLKRSYSLASSPTRQGIFEITVKRDPNGGIVSNWLHDHLKIGDTINLKGPFGKFSCASHRPKKILFLAAGSGIVPIMSMLRWLCDTEADVDVQLILSFQRLDDIMYRSELELIAVRHRNIRITITLTKPALLPENWYGLIGRINQAMLHALVGDLPERNVYLCGPTEFMSDCKKNLSELSHPPEQLFCESFAANTPAAQVNSGLPASRQKIGT